MKEELKFATSRKRFFYLYLFGLLVLFLYPMSEFAAMGEIYNYIFVSLITIVILYPELLIIYTTYIVGNDVIIETSGIITKKRTTIPISSISHVVMKKGITGRFLNYGDVVITSFTDLIITFQGINNPEKVLKKIENMMEFEKRKR
jgi:uncharacterized membrane protein YdbT with pleckstrin-like domain